MNRYPRFVCPLDSVSGIPDRVFGMLGSAVIISLVFIE